MSLAYSSSYLSISLSLPAGVTWQGRRIRSASVELIVAQLRCSLRHDTDRSSAVRDDVSNMR